MRVEPALESARLRKARDDFERLVLTAAIHDHDVSRPTQTLKRASDVRRFVIGQDERSNLFKHFTADSLYARREQPTDREHLTSPLPRSRRNADAQNLFLLRRAAVAHLHRRAFRLKFVPAHALLMEQSNQRPPSLSPARD